MTYVFTKTSPNTLKQSQYIVNSHVTLQNHTFCLRFLQCHCLLIKSMELTLAQMAKKLAPVRKVHSRPHRNAT